MPSNSREDIGARGEAIVRKWLKRQGYLILPASLIKDTGAPMLTGEQIKAILPNNLTWKEGQPGWVEVKTKSCATEHVNPPHRWEHGFPLRQWQAYCLVEEVTKIPVSLAVLELDEKLLLIGKLEGLKRGKEVRYMEGEPHVFLNRLNRKLLSDFPEWYTLDESLPEPIQPIAERTYKQGKAPIVKQFELL